MKNKNAHRLCPCFSGSDYTLCCKKYHEGSVAETALLLMRSRYAAYALGLADYIILTTHPLSPYFQIDTKRWKKEILHFTHQTIFVNLLIINCEEKQKEAFVTFRAELKQQNQDASFTEKSRFLLESGKWLYVSGSFSS